MVGKKVRENVIWRRKGQRWYLEWRRGTLRRRAEELKAVFQGPAKSRYQQLRRLAQGDQTEELEHTIRELRMIESLTADLVRLRKRGEGKNPRLVLKNLIRAVKSKNSDLSQLGIARRCDQVACLMKIQISRAFPPSWRRVTNPPRTLEDAYEHPRLHSRVKSYISDTKPQLAS